MGYDIVLPTLSINKINLLNFSELPGPGAELGGSHVDRLLGAGSRESLAGAANERGQMSPIIWMAKPSTYGYGSIPINTIFRGMNIHKSQLFWCELQGYQGFDTLPYMGWTYGLVWSTLMDINHWENTWLWPFGVAVSKKRRDWFNQKKAFVEGVSPIG